MSFDPKTGGPAGFPATPKQWREFGNDLRDALEAQKAKPERTDDDGDRHRQPACD